MIVVAGATSLAAGGDFAVLRLKPDGTLDPNFSPGGIEGNGIFVRNIGGGDSANALAIQSDGRILVAGATSLAAGGDFAVARLTTTGTLDPSFSPGALMEVEFRLSAFREQTSLTAW